MRRFQLYYPFVHRIINNLLPPRTVSAVIGKLVLVPSMMIELINFILAI